MENPIKLVDLYSGSRVRAGALEWLYELIKERSPEINISHVELPTFEQHRAFWNRRVYRCCYLIEAEAQAPRDGTLNGPIEFQPVWVGYVSATHNNEIGIVLLNEHRGRGFGPRAVKLLMSLHKPNPPEPGVRHRNWLANIAPANERSLVMFTKLGFKQIQITYEFKEEEQHG